MGWPRLSTEERLKREKERKKKYYQTGKYKNYVKWYNNGGRKQIAKNLKDPNFIITRNY